MYEVVTIERKLQKNIIRYVRGKEDVLGVLDQDAYVNKTFFPFIIMPHEYHNDHDCGHESDSHDHSHELISDLGSQDNLFLHIDRDNAIALNTSGSGSNVIKPWHTRLDETQVTHEHFLADGNIF